MKYLLLAAFIISCFAISCDDQKEIINTGTTAETNVYDKDEVEAIISNINTSSRIDNVDEWDILTFEPVDITAGQDDHTSSNADVCTPRAGHCGPCEGFCMSRNIHGHYEIDGILNTNNGVISHSLYNAGYRTVYFGVIRHRQTGVKKILVDFTDPRPYLQNNRVYLPNDTRLFNQLTQRLNQQNIILRAGTYAATLNTSTGNAQTVIDAIIQ